MVDVDKEKKELVSVVDKTLDITGCDDIEIEVSIGTGNGMPVLWLHTSTGLKLRICRIRGNVTFIDNRPLTPQIR